MSGIPIPLVSFMRHTGTQSYQNLWRKLQLGWSHCLPSSSVSPLMTSFSSIANNIFHWSSSHTGLYSTVLMAGMDTFFISISPSSRIIPQKFAPVVLLTSFKASLLSILMADFPDISILSMKETKRSIRTILICFSL